MRDICVITEEHYICQSLPAPHCVALLCVVVRDLRGVSFSLSLILAFVLVVQLGNKSLLLFSVSYPHTHHTCAPDKMLLLMYMHVTLMLPNLLSIPALLERVHCPLFFIFIVYFLLSIKKTLDFTAVTSYRVRELRGKNTKPTGSWGSWRSWCRRLEVKHMKCISVKGLRPRTEHVTSPGLQNTQKCCECIQKNAGMYSEIL